jgi:8-oxo-dGTP pyrophosphatase MutT (NUDIX family)
MQEEKYVLGFVFDLDVNRVLLIQKQKPSWQRGFYNGIGGMKEPTDLTYAEAMVRECEEETGVKTKSLHWHHFCTMGEETSRWLVQCYYTTLQEIQVDKSMFVSMTKEEVYFHPLKAISIGHPQLLGNIPWLVAMALDHHYNRAIEHSVITYNGGFSLPLKGLQYADNG